MRIYVDSVARVLELDGVRMSFDLLRALANPCSERFYRLVRDGDVVSVESFDVVELSRVAAQQSGVPQ